MDPPVRAEGREGKEMCCGRRGEGSDNTLEVFGSERIVLVNKVKALYF